MFTFRSRVTVMQDIYQGMPGVERGEVRWLRVLEETSRTSATPGGANPYNQTFLLSSALTFSVKDFLGIVPVDEHGSAYFEAPAGRALYFQALDGEGRLVQSMRSVVQAAPGTVRSCVGCHLENGDAPNAPPGDLLGRAPLRLQPEAWGRGLLDYPRAFSRCSMPIASGVMAERKGSQRASTCPAAGPRRRTSWSPK